MSDKTDSDRLEAALLRRLATVDEWLRFAEAKNGAFIAVCLALGAGLIALGTADGTLDVAGREWIVGGLFAVAASLMFALISYIPQTSIPVMLRVRTPNPSDSDNLDFYGDLRKYSREALIENLATLYGVEVAVINKIHLDLADQVRINSRIAYQKFAYFTLSVYVLGSSMTVVTLLAAVQAIA